VLGRDRVVRTCVHALGGQRASEYGGRGERVHGRQCLSTSEAMSIEEIECCRKHSVHSESKHDVM
jgi:hypothetical protein